VGLFLRKKNEESAVRTIESKGFLQTSPLLLGYRAPATDLGVWLGRQGHINDHAKPAQARRDHQYYEPVLAQMWMVTTKTAIEQCPLDLQENLEEK
jgi:hypothetical protein